MLIYCRVFRSSTEVGLLSQSFRVCQCVSREFAVAFTHGVAHRISESSLIYVVIHNSYTRAKTKLCLNQIEPRSSDSRRRRPFKIASGILFIVLLGHLFGAAGACMWGAHTHNGRP